MPHDNVSKSPSCRMTKLVETQRCCKASLVSRPSQATSRNNRVKTFGAQGARRQVATGALPNGRCSPACASRLLACEASRNGGVAERSLFHGRSWCRRNQTPARFGLRLDDDAGGSEAHRGER